MRQLFLISFLIFLQSCNDEKAIIEFDNQTKTITLLTDNYHLKHVLVNEIKNGNRLDSVYSAIDIYEPVKKINLLSLNKNDSLFGMEMKELLKRKDLEFKIALEHDDPENTKFPLTLIYFRSSEIQEKKEIFESF